MCMYPDTPVTLTCARKLICSVVSTQLRWLMPVNFGKGVEPMLCCMYPYMLVTLANASCYAG